MTTATPTRAAPLKVVRPVDELTMQALDLVQAEYDKYIVFPSAEHRDAVTLWILHTHVFRSFETTPRLSVRSKEPGSGKSRVLDIAGHLVPGPAMAIDMTPAVMFRTLERGNVTMFIDEADTIWGKGGSGSSHTQRRAVINAGHHMNGTVMRPQGVDDVREFNVFGPMALAGIGRLPETVWTRSVEIPMRRRKPGDPKVKAFRYREAADGLKAARAACEAWAARAATPLKYSRPELPVQDRSADVWEPLIAIADMASEEWSIRARKACEKLDREQKGEELSAEAELVAAALEAFGEAEALAVAEFATRMRKLDGWQDISSRDAARMLADMGIRATTVRFDGRPTRAYKRADFRKSEGEAHAMGDAAQQDTR